MVDEVWSSGKASPSLFIISISCLAVNGSGALADDTAGAMDTDVARVEGVGTGSEDEGGAVLDFDVGEEGHPGGGGLGATPDIVAGVEAGGGEGFAAHGGFRGVEFVDVPEAAGFAAAASWGGAGLGGDGGRDADEPAYRIDRPRFHWPEGGAKAFRCEGEQNGFARFDFEAGPTGSDASVFGDLVVLRGEELSE